MPPNKHLQTFISYSRVNQQFAIKLACELKSAGFSIWMDQFDIPTGARWDDEIEKALRECQIFLFIITPASIASENAKDEVGYAIDHGKRILPVLLEECEVPLRLRRLQHVDFTHKSFNEGINSAKELLTKLVNEIEAPTPKTVNVISGTTHKRRNNDIPDEPKTAPARRKGAQDNIQNAARRSRRHRSKQIAAGVGILIIGTLIIATLIFKTPIFASLLPSSPTTTLAATESVLVPTDTSMPTNIPDTPNPEFPRSFKEDFDSDIQWNTNWTRQFRHENPTKQKSFKYEITGGDLIFDLNNEFVWAYFLYRSDNIYNNIELEAIVADLESTDTFGLVCQYSNQGWYEFNINGGGKFYVRYVDNMESDRDEGGFLIDDGYIPGFKDSFTTVRENLIRVICNGNNLSLSVNDVVLTDKLSKQFVLEQGQIGVSIRSYENYPVHFVVRSVTVREP